jgi:hypothetical protein
MYIDKISNEFSELFKGADKLEELIEKEKEIGDISQQPDLNQNLNDKNVNELFEEP